jgi:hypothetical protein
MDALDLQACNTRTLEILVALNRYFHAYLSHADRGEFDRDQRK